MFAFCGSFASIPLMLHEVVQVRHWVEPKVFIDGIALGQATPGPIAITAAFVGYVVRAPWGAVIGTESNFLPSFLLVISVAPVFLRPVHLFPKGDRGRPLLFRGPARERRRSTGHLADFGCAADRAGRARVRGFVVSRQPSLDRSRGSGIADFQVLEAILVTLFRLSRELP